MSLLFCVRKLTGSLLGLLVVVGCNDVVDTTDESSRTTHAVPVRTAPELPRSARLTVDELRQQLGVGDEANFVKAGGQFRAAELADSAVNDLSPLEGLPLEALDLKGTNVSDLSPLKGMPLTKLFLEETNVTDLTPLAGMRLEELYLSKTPVVDLSPLMGMRIGQFNLVETQITDLAAFKEIEFGTLWVVRTKVADLSPLAGKSFASLDVEGTQVTDLSPLTENESLRRLNIAETPVSDLTPLAGLKLERLIFTPGRITVGLDAIRKMETLQQVDVSFEDPQTTLTPAAFWAKYDAGGFSSE